MRCSFHATAAASSIAALSPCLMFATTIMCLANRLVSRRERRNIARNRKERSQEALEVPVVHACEHLVHDHGVAIPPTGSGERALESGPIVRPTVRREHMLDRPLEQRAQPLGDLLVSHAVR